jgi:hypothetical protein
MANKRAGFNNNPNESKVALTHTVPTRVTVEDDRQPGTLSWPAVEAVQTSEAT